MIDTATESWSLLLYDFFLFFAFIAPGFEPTLVSVVTTQLRSSQYFHGNIIKNLPYLQWHHQMAAGINRWFVSVVTRVLLLALRMTDRLPGVC